MRMRDLPALLAQNWTLKFAALGLAILLWVSVRVDSFNRHEVEGVPVQVELNDPRWALLGESMPTSVQVRFAGPFRELFRITWERPTLVIPIEEVASPDTAVLLRTQWVRVQDRPGVVIEDIFPSSVRLAFEPIETENVPLEPRVTGRLPADLALAAPVTASPSIARISGPASGLERVDTIFTRPFDLSRVTESGTHPVALDTAGLGRLQVAPTSASLSVRVEALLERTFDDIPIELDGEVVDPALELDRESATATVAGPRSVVEAMEPGDLRASIRVGSAIRELEPGEERRAPVRIDGVPDFVTVRVSLDSVTVRLRRDP
jgi:YbbR domain-containing protein